MNAKRLPEKDPGETVPLSWDFTADLGTATISGTPTIVVSVDKSLWRGADPSPSSILNSTPQVSGKTVIQSIKAGIDGVDYKVTCEIGTNGMPASKLFKTSILPVRAQ